VKKDFVHSLLMTSDPPTAVDVCLPLCGQRVISLRPVGAHAALRRAAARYGMHVLALSPWTLVWRSDAATRRALEAALQAEVVVVTSPAAVAAACRLHTLSAQPGQTWVAVGAGTAQRLRRAGVKGVIAPEQMDSEGVLALPVLRALHGQCVGLITAPGGRGVMGPALVQRGAALIRADVYERVPACPAPSALARLSVPGPLWLVLSSQAALAGVLERLPDTALQRLRMARVVAASTRLARYALGMGWSIAAIATDARPASLLRAIARAAASGDAVSSGQDV